MVAAVVATGKHLVVLPDTNLTESATRLICSDSRVQWAFQEMKRCPRMVERILFRWDYGGGDESAALSKHLLIERFCKSCRELASRYSAFHQVKPFRRGHILDQTGLEAFLTSRSTLCLWMSQSRSKNQDPGTLDASCQGARVGTVAEAFVWLQAKAVKTAWPMSTVPMLAPPRGAISLVRSPESSTFCTAVSIAAASCSS